MVIFLNESGKINRSQIRQGYLEGLLENINDQEDIGDYVFNIVLNFRFILRFLGIFSGFKCERSEGRCLFIQAYGIIYEQREKEDEDIGQNVLQKNKAYLRGYCWMGEYKK